MRTPTLLPLLDRLTDEALADRFYAALAKISDFATDGHERCLWCNANATDDCDPNADDDVKLDIPAFAHAPLCPCRIAREALEVQRHCELELREEP